MPPSPESDFVCVMIRRAESTGKDPIYTCGMDEDTTPLGNSLRRAHAPLDDDMRGGSARRCMDVVRGGGVEKRAGVHVGAGRRLEERRLAGAWHAAVGERERKKKGEGDWKATWTWQISPL